MLTAAPPTQKNPCMEQRREYKCFIRSCDLWPRFFTLFLLVLLFSLSASQFETPTAESATDRLALLSFKSSISDPSGALASWDNSSLHFCDWRGVKCQSRSGVRRVMALNLESLNLAGTLSPSIGNLTFLRRLSLTNNSLRGPVPPELGFLSHLRRLDLSDNPLGGMIPTSLFQNCSKLKVFSLIGNNLSGTIPRNLSNCQRLELIDLTHNMLQGEIPRDLCSLSKLQTLDLSFNGLTGSIPPVIGNLESLQTLALAFNGLTGSIPPVIGNLQSLTLLHLQSNHLDGTIPAAIGNLSSLRDLILLNNSLTGAIPTSIGNLTSLAFFSVYDNELTGAIPSDIGNLTNLTMLILGVNHLVGIIPKSLGALKNLDLLILDNNMLEASNSADWSFLDAITNCTRLRRLDISNNNIGGMLPKSIANLSRNLELLHMSGNQIGGSIPTEIGNLVSLTDIVMSSNHVFGTIPEALGSLWRLGNMDLGSNYFVGEIPTSFGNLTTLNTLVLATNELSGPIPPSLGKCPLNTLNLAFNKLNGTLPIEILSIPSLSKILNVSHNSLTGSLPSETGYSITIQTIDVSNNRLSGEIPSSIADCQELQYLYMQGNSFWGSIPLSFSHLKGLQVLDLSSNALSGQIPDFLQSLSSLNLSYNNFSGEVPEDGVFGNSSAFLILGNNNLCGGAPKLGLPSCSSRKKHLSKKIIVVITIVGGILCLILLISIFAATYFLSKSRRLPSATSSIKEQHRMVSFSELLRATNGFSPANVIGTGSFGYVYKGIMDWQDHQYVAVKVLNHQQKRATKSFLSECEVLRNIRHRNLVKILTSCSSVDFQGNDFKALVFEFLPNGDLDKWLHPKVDELGELNMLSLIHRLNISIDVAAALDYLHHHGSNPIVHCDLKPSNVLLDHDMVAHVGDFGLARFLKKSVSTSSVRSTNSATLKGSVGYAAPEYGMANKVSVQGDVYSYGILLLEIFTGKRPTDDTFEGGLDLRQYVDMALPERVVEIIDPHLLEGREGEMFHSNMSANERIMRTIECVTSVLRIGILCSTESPKERMHMKDVTRELHSVRNAFLGLAPWQE